MKKIITFLLLSTAIIIQAPVNATVQHFQIKEPCDLDYIWQMYSMTKDKAYLQQILECINTDDETLFLAYEYLNRMYLAQLMSQLQNKNVPAETEDLKKILAEKESQSPGFHNHFVLVTTAMWSLDSNLMKKEQTKLDYKAIIDEHPELNYSTRINALLSN